MIERFTYEWFVLKIVKECESVTLAAEKQVITLAIEYGFAKLIQI